MPDALGWFACGALFSAVLHGWPWHPRFRRHIRLGRSDYPLFTEGHVQRGNGHGRLSTEKPVITAKPQFPPARRVPEDLLP